MDTEVAKALTTDNIIDITTTGRKTGQLRRIEIRFDNLGGELVITGMPSTRRSWYANMVAHPEFTFHLKMSMRADIPAKATPITDSAERRDVYTRLAETWRWSEERKSQELAGWIETAALVRLELDNG